MNEEVEAARMLCLCSRGEHIKGIMKERLHWLKISEQISFKLCMLVYKSLRGKAPGQHHHHHHHHQFNNHVLPRLIKGMDGCFPTA